MKGVIARGGCGDDRMKMNLRKVSLNRSTFHSAYHHSMAVTKTSAGGGGLEHPLHLLHFALSCNLGGLSLQLAVFSLLEGEEEEEVERQTAAAASNQANSLSLLSLSVVLITKNQELVITITSHNSQVSVIAISDNFAILVGTALCCADSSRPVIGIYGYLSKCSSNRNCDYFVAN